jgi:predicted MPP superfamily phosphohydrolase
MTVAFVAAVALTLGLAFLLFREVRRPVEGGDWIRSGRSRKLIRVALAAIVLATALAAFWGFLIEPRRLVTRLQTIQIQDWPRDLDGLRVAVISDIHADDWFVDEKKLRTIVERTNQLQPELIVIMGDYMSSDGWVQSRVKPEVFAAVLKDFRAPLGVYSVLGNHDWWYDGARVRHALEQNGITVLEDEVVRLDARGTSFWLIGLADLWTRKPKIEETVDMVPLGQPMIAITHNPDIFPDLPQRTPLLLAGHTHGGQVSFPLIGTVVESSRFGERYGGGHVFENNHHLFVTTGIGTSIIPVRFGVPPEIVLLTVGSP